jgi:hypothetical protein
VNYDPSLYSPDLAPIPQEKRSAGTSAGKNAPWFGKAGENSTVWESPSPKFLMGGSDEEKFAAITNAILRNTRSIPKDFFNSIYPL